MGGRQSRDQTLELIKGARVENLPTKIIFASIPRSGNSWMRQLIEMASGIRAAEHLLLLAPGHANVASLPT